MSGFVWRTAVNAILAIRVILAILGILVTCAILVIHAHVHVTLVIRVTLLDPTRTRVRAYGAGIVPLLHFEREEPDSPNKS